MRIAEEVSWCQTPWVVIVGNVIQSIMTETASTQTREENEIAHQKEEENTENRKKKKWMKKIAMKVSKLSMKKSLKREMKRELSSSSNSALEQKVLKIVTDEEAESNEEESFHEADQIDRH